MPELIGEILDATPDSVTYRYRGDEQLPANQDGVPDLGAVDIAGPETAHYTDSREAYEAAVANVTGFLGEREIKSGAS